MKRILFVIPYLTTGGTNRSLQCLLSFIDPKKYAADVFVLAGGGLYENKFPHSTLLPVDKFVDSIIGHIDNKKGFGLFLSVFSKGMCKLTNYEFQRYIFNQAAKRIDSNRYDAIIAYSEGVATEFVSAIKHHNKIAWIHCDYASYYAQNSNKNESHIYDSFSSVVCVSQFTRQSFLKFYPSYTTKTFAVPNLIDDKMMEEKADEVPNVGFDKSLFNIVSIGRIDPVKQLSAIPEVAAKLHCEIPRIRWYIIGPQGDANEYNSLKENLIKFDCSDYVLLLGEKENPYPYIRQADLLVVPSKSEACPYVINEAKVLGTPVVSTDFGSANEFLQDGLTGFIAPLTNLHTTIQKIITDKALYNSICSRISEFKYDNVTLLKTITELFNGQNN